MVPEANTRGELGTSWSEQEGPAATIIFIVNSDKLYIGREANSIL